MTVSAKVWPLVSSCSAHANEMDNSAEREMTSLIGDVCTITHTDQETRFSLQCGQTKYMVLPHQV